MAEPWLALQVVMMPRDANPIIGGVTLQGQRHYPLYNTVFGGVILSHIDMAGAIAARREISLLGGAADITFVTVAINRVEFKQPVLVGDVVRFETSCVRIGRTSVTIHINVEAERGRDRLRVTEAEVVYVGVDMSNGERKPTVLLPQNN